MMKIKRLMILLTATLAVAGTAFAQLNLPTKMLGNDAYYYYKVKGGESVHGIAQTIGVSVDDLVKYNPSARDGVNKGQMLFLPVNEFSKATTTAPATPASTSVFTPAPERVEHVVKRGESVYGIARAYNLLVDDLIEANPVAAAGVKPGDVLFIPQPASPTALTSKNATLDEEVPAPEPLEEGVIFHTIKRGESLYSLSKRYNTSIESIMALNPGVTADHFLADDVIKIKPGESREIVVNTTIRQFIPYVAQEHDTFESVAAAHGINVADLRAANPDIDKLKKGKTVYLPLNGTDTRVINSANASEQELENTYSNRIDDVYNEVHGITHSDKINIAIVLPFQLHKSDPPRQALLYTDYYRGFAVAIDSIANKCGKQVFLDVYDTEHNLNVTDSLLALDKMKTYDVIVAPSEPKQLERINRFGKENNVTVLNVFSTKNEDYTSNPMTMQVNIPSSYLAARVMDFIDRKYKDYTIVYLEDPDLERKDIYRDLQAHFKATGQPTKTLTIVHNLTAKAMSQYMDPGTNYLFLPSSGEKSLLKKVATGIEQVKEQRYDCEVAFIGYPEYTMFSGEFKTQLQNIDSYIFSRFYNPCDSRVTDIENRYHRLFDDDIMNTTPNMMLLGFDSGMFIINTLAADKTLQSPDADYRGIQSSFDFERPNNWGGCINKSVRFIHFTPEGKVTVEE